MKNSLPYFNTGSSRMILEWSIDNEEYSDDEDYYEDFENFSIKHKDITEKVEYVFVCTGYASRLIRYEDIFHKIKNEHTDAIVIIPDKYEGLDKGPEASWIREKEYQLAYDICAKLPQDFMDSGGIIYKVDKPEHTELSYVEKVGELDFCGFCNVDCTNATWWEVDEHIILVFDVDTESG